MPRFFFDSDDGRFQVRDDEGSQLPDAVAARDMALATLPEMAMHQRASSDRRTFALRVRDEAGATIYTATLSLVGEWHVEVPPSLRRTPSSA